MYFNKKVDKWIPHKLSKDNEIRPLAIGNSLFTCGAFY